MGRSLLLILLLTLPARCLARPLQRSTPEAQGIPSAAILAFVDAAEDSLDALHSFMLLRHGKVVAEGWWRPYNADSRHQLYSLSKSFTSTAVGLAIDAGLLSLDDRLVDLFPEAAPAEPSDNLRAMRLRDLLRMNSGHLAAEADSFWSLQRSTWVEAFLAVPVSLKPGTHFVYNTGGTYVAGAAVQKRTGQRLVDYLTPRLFAPLGIEGATWEQNGEGLDTGGWGLNLRTEDIARFGQLYLQDGVWEGKRVLPRGWVEEATARQTSNGSDPASDWEQGYGYQFWRCRHGAYRGDGAFGQYCIVMPEQDAVLAITAGVPDMQVVLNLVWRHLLAGMGDRPLRRADTEALRQRLGQLQLPTQAGAASSPLAPALAGRRFVFEENEHGFASVAFASAQDGADVTIAQTDGTVRHIQAGHGEWVAGRLALWGGDEQPVAASAAWESPEALSVKLCYYETPFHPRMTFRPEGDRLRVDVEFNASFGPRKWEQMVARAD